MVSHPPVFYYGWNVLDCQEAIYLAFVLYVVWWQWLGDRWKLHIISIAPILPRCFESRQTVPQGFSRRQDDPKCLTHSEAHSSPYRCLLSLQVPLPASCILKLFSQSAVSSGSFRRQLFPQISSAVSCSLKIPRQSYASSRSFIAQLFPQGLFSCQLYTCLDFHRLDIKGRFQRGGSGGIEEEEEQEEEEKVAQVSHSCVCQQSQLHASSGLACATTAPILCVTLPQ